MARNDANRYVSTVSAACSGARPKETADRHRWQPAGKGPNPLIAAVLCQIQPLRGQGPQEGDPSPIDAHPGVELTGIKTAANDDGRKILP